VLSGELLLGLLELSGIEVGVAEAVTKQVNGFGNIILEASNFNVLPFTVSRSTDTSSHLLNFLRKICLRSGLSSAGKHHTESISGSASLNCVLTRASTDVYTNTIAQQHIKVKGLVFQLLKINFTYDAVPLPLASVQTLMPLDKVVLSEQL
jgi:hypothetical protein